LPLVFYNPTYWSFRTLYRTRVACLCVKRTHHLFSAEPAQRACSGAPSVGSRLPSCGSLGAGTGKAPGRAVSVTASRSEATGPLETPTRVRALAVRCSARSRLCRPQPGHYCARLSRGGCGRWPGRPRICPSHMPACARGPVASGPGWASAGGAALGSDDSALQAAPARGAGRDGSFQVGSHRAAANGPPALLCQSQWHIVTAAAPPLKAAEGARSLRAGSHGAFANGLRGTANAESPIQLLKSESELPVPHVPEGQAASASPTHGPECTLKLAPSVLR
jgi:hypothetical protein